MFENEKVREVLAHAARNVWGTACTLATVGGVLVLLAALTYYDIGTEHHIDRPLLAAGTWVALLLISAAGLWWVRNRYIRYNRSGKRVMYIEATRTIDVVLANTVVEPGGFYWCRYHHRALLYTVSLPASKERVATNTVTRLVDLGIEGSPMSATIHYSLTALFEGEFNAWDLLQIALAGYGGVKPYLEVEFGRALAGAGSALAKAATLSLQTNDHNLVAETVQKLVQEHEPWLEIPGSATWTKS